MFREVSQCVINLWQQKQMWFMSNHCLGKEQTCEEQSFKQLSKQISFQNTLKINTIYLNVTIIDH